MNVEVSRERLDLSSTVAEGDIRCLLMVLMHMTGDERWLEPPYKPKRDVRLIPDPDAGLPQAIQDEIRAAVVNLFARGHPKPVISDPGDELMLRMMRACLGENVTPEYAPLMREEMGFVARDARWTKAPSNETLAQQHVLIVGAGVCAIALGVALGRLGIPYTIVEKNDELGGTWYINRYPGCGVDTPNHSYSYSFGSRNPWTRYFCQREELLDYLLRRGKYGQATHSPRPGLILLDLNMPRKDGREVLREIKATAELRKIPVVVFTTSKADTDIESVYELGANSFISKPVQFEGLVNLMRVIGQYWFGTVELPLAK